MINRNLVIILLLFLQNIVAQNISQENYTPKFSSTNGVGNIIFCNDSKQISIKLFGKKFEDVEIGNSDKLPNRYFVAVDEVAIQAVLIPIPKNITSAYDMKNLTSEQQKQILSGYMSYEVEYMNSDPETSVHDVSFAEGDSIRKHIIWNYFFNSYKEEKDTKGDLVIGQFCMSTIVFDKVLTVTIALLKSYDANPVEVLKKIVENVETREGDCN